MTKRQKLSDAEVLEIRRFVDEGWTLIYGGRQAEAIGRAYGVSEQYVGNVGRRDQRGRVPEAADSPFR